MNNVHEGAMYFWMEVTEWISDTSTQVWIGLPEIFAYAELP